MDIAEEFIRGLLKVIHEFLEKNAKSRNRVEVEELYEKLDSYGDVKSGWSLGRIKTLGEVTHSENEGFLNSTELKVPILFQIKSFRKKNKVYYLCYTSSSWDSANSYGGLCLIKDVETAPKIARVFSYYKGEVTRLRRPQYNFLFKDEPLEVRRFVEPADPIDLEEYYGLRQIQYRDEEYFDHDSGDWIDDNEEDDAWEDDGSMTI